MIKRKSINLSAIAITNFEKLNLIFIKRNPRRSPKRIALFYFNLSRYQKQFEKVLIKQESSTNLVRFEKKRQPTLRQIRKISGKFKESLRIAISVLADLLPL